MANKRFQFKLLTSSDPQAQYSAIAAHDAYTFYLLGDGTGYLGDIPLFGGDAEKFNLITTAGEASLEAGKVYIFAVDGVTVGGVAKSQGIYYSPDGTTVDNVTYKTIAQYIIDNAIKAADVDETFTGTETDIMTSAAIVQYVSDVVNTQAILDVNFFKKVDKVVLTQEDIDDKANGTATGPLKTAYSTIDIGADAHVDDIGLVFTFDDLTSFNADGSSAVADDDTDDKPESYAFINLCKLINIYDVTTEDDALNITSDTTADGHKTTFKLAINRAESLDADVIAAASVEIAENADPVAAAAAYNAGLSEDKLVTENQLATILAKILKDYVRYDVDDDAPATPTV